MKKITALILSVVLVFSLAACSNTQQNDVSDPVSSEAHSLVAESTPAEGTETEGSNILIAYFTYGENAELPDDVIPLQLKPGDAAQKAGVQEQVLLMIGICTEIRRRFCPFRSAQGARGQTARQSLSARTKFASANSIFEPIKIFL